MLPDSNRSSIWTGELEPAIGLKARNAWSVAIPSLSEFDQEVERRCAKLRKLNPSASRKEQLQYVHSWPIGPPRVPRVAEDGRAGHQGIRVTETGAFWTPDHLIDFPHGALSP
jgi:hypothetical protein